MVVIALKHKVFLFVRQNTLKKDGMHVKRLWLIEFERMYFFIHSVECIRINWREASLFCIFLYIYTFLTGDISETGCLL